MGILLERDVYYEKVMDTNLIISQAWPAASVCLDTRIPLVTILTLTIRKFHVK